MSSNDGYRALRSGTAFLRRTDRGLIRLRGADRGTWLQGLVTNDVAALEPGSRSYGAYLTPQGRMITDLWAVPVADALLLDIPTGLAASLAARLDSLIFAEDVQIDDLGESTAVVELYGPELGPEPPFALPGEAVLAAVADRTLGLNALAVYLPASLVPEFARLARERGFVEIDLPTLDVVRVEAGIPAFPADMTEETIPLEAGIEDRAISFTKGCYVGQEVIVRVTQRGGGRVAKKLVGLTLEGAAEAAAGAPIRDGARDIGRVTSCVTSPGLSRVIALGYVHRDFVTPGTAVQVGGGDALIPAVVTALPFVPSLVREPGP